MRKTLFRNTTPYFKLPSTQDLSKAWESRFVCSVWKYNLLTVAISMKKQTFKESIFVSTCVWESLILKMQPVNEQAIVLVLVMTYRCEWTSHCFSFGNRCGGIHVTAKNGLRMWEEKVRLNWLRILRSDFLILQSHN